MHTHRYTHTHERAHTHRCMHTHRCTHTQVHTHARAHTHRCMHTHTHTLVPTHTHTRAHTHRCIHTNTGAHVHTHTHTTHQSKSGFAAIITDLSINFGLHSKQPGLRIRLFRLLNPDYNRKYHNKILLNPFLDFAVQRIRISTIRSRIDIIGL